MEPVPETERMEEFRPSPVPSLRLANGSNINHAPLSSLDADILKKPAAPRRSADLNPVSPILPPWTPTMHSTISTTIPYRPRTASPLSGGHSRSHSAASLAPAMSRTQSMPGVNGSGRILYSPHVRPASPSGSPSRSRTPRKPLDESFPLSSPVRVSVLESEKRRTDRSRSPSFGVSGASSRLRRPTSPFRSLSHSGSSSLSMLPSTPSSSSSSSYRGYDALSTGYGGNLSSVPSTPTSARSRSPSISSLETIPDSPDAEEAALEAERLAQLKAAADSENGSSDTSDSKGRGSLDVPTRGRTLSFGPRDKRKRWSVCGAERRGDLDLETIWED